MQENLAFLQSARKPNAKNRKITEAILKVQDSLNKNNLGVQEKDVNNNLIQIWNFFFTLIKHNSLSIQNSIERCADIFIMRNYSFYPEKIEKLLISQIKSRKNISDNKRSQIEAAKKDDNEKSGLSIEDSPDNPNYNPQNEGIIYDSSLSKYDNLLLQIFTYISPKISSMRIDSFLENCKESGILLLFSMKGNTTINNTVPKYISNLKSLGIEWHIDLLSSFLSEKVEYSQIKSINAIIDNYPSLFRRVLTTSNFSLISFILSIHNNSNDIFTPDISSRYFSNLNNFPRTDDLINSLYKSTTISDIDNFLMILSCDKDVKIRIETKKEGNDEEEENQEEEEEESENALKIDNKIVIFYSTSKFSRDLPLSKVIARSSFYNFSDLPFKYLLPRDDDSVFILTVKFQKIAQRATLKNCKQIFSIFNHFLNERQNQNQNKKSKYIDDGDDNDNEKDAVLNSTPFYDELTSACLQNLPICINIFSVLPDFPSFLKKVLLVKPASWLHASDISKVLGSLNSVHFDKIGGLTTIISKLIQFSMSSNKQLSNNAIDSIVRISNINNCDKILQIIYNSFDDFDPLNVTVNLRIVSKLVEKNNFYFCILTTFLERVLEISMLFPNDLLLLSEIHHFAATIKNKTSSSSYSSNSFIVNETKENENNYSIQNPNSNQVSFGYGRNMKYLKESAFSLVYTYIQFFTGSSNNHPPQSLHASIDNFYTLVQNYVNSSDFDQIQFSFLFNALDFLVAFPSVEYRTLALILCDDLINVFPKEVSEFAVKNTPNMISQSFYKAFDYFSKTKDIEVGAIWCNVFFKMNENNPDNPTNKQLDDKVTPVFEKMADFAFSSPTKISKYCLNTLSLYLLKYSPSKTKLKTLVENLNNKEAKQSTLSFLYKEDEAEFKFVFPNISMVKGTKIRIIEDNTNTNTSKRKSNDSDEYSDDDDEDDSDFERGNDSDSDSFSDKSQQNELSFTFNKVDYKELLKNYIIENENENENVFLTKNYLILTQMKYYLVNFSTKQLKILINYYFEFCDYYSLFALIIYCMRYRRNFPFSEFSEQFKITPFKNLSTFLCKAGNLRNHHNENQQIGISTSVISLTSACLLNEHVSDDENEDESKFNDQKNIDVYDQFLYYYDRFMFSWDKRDSNFSLLKEMRSIDHLSCIIDETASSMSTKSNSNTNDRTSSKNSFVIRYLYDENEYDIESFAEISSSIDHVFSPIPLADSYSYSRISSKVSVTKRILELLSLSETIKKTIKNDKLSKKPLKRILSCIPIVNKSFLDDDIDLLEFSLIVFSKAEKKSHMKFALLVLSTIVKRMKTPWKEAETTDATSRERSKSVKEKSSDKDENVKNRSSSLKSIQKPYIFEKNFTINENFIDNFFSIVRENSELLPREELFMCIRAITERTICQEDSKLHEIIKSVVSCQQEFISPTSINLYMSLLNFTTKFESNDIVQIWTKLFTFKGIPSFFIRGCSVVYFVIAKTVQMTNCAPLKNAIQAIFDARKEFFNGMTDGINSLLNIFADFDNTLSTSAVDLARKIQKIYNSHESLIKTSSSASFDSKTTITNADSMNDISTITTNSNQAQNISLNQANARKNYQSNNDNFYKFNSQNCTCNFFVDKMFYCLSFLVLSSSNIQTNIYTIIKQYEAFIVDPRRAEFEFDSYVLPYLIKKLNTSPVAIKKVQSYVSAFIMPRHIATVTYHNNRKSSSEKVDSDSEKVETFDVGGFDIIATSLLPIYLQCIVEVYNIVPDSLNNISSRITNNLLEWLRMSKDFDSFYFSDFIWRWNVLVAKYSGAENALNLSCTTFPNFLPRFFPLFAAIVKFVKNYGGDGEGAASELFKGFLSNAALVSQEKSKAHGVAFSLLAADDRLKDALDLAQFDRDCDESGAIISYLMASTTTNKKKKEEEEEEEEENTQK